MIPEQLEILMENFFGKPMPDPFADEDGKMESAPDSEDWALKIWLRWGDLMSLYHQYEVDGLENLDGKGAKLIVGYHGRGIAADLVILSGVLYRRLGYLPRSIMHSFFSHQEQLRKFNDSLGFVTKDGPEIDEAVKAGQHIIVLPGGVREGQRSYRERYRVNWGPRVGFIRLALKHKLQIVPVVCSGVDDTYIGLNDGYEWGKKLGLPFQLPAWLALGPLGPAPFSPPFPVKFRQTIGTAIDLEDDGPIDPEKPEELKLASERVQRVMQRLLDKTRCKAYQDH